MARRATRWGLASLVLLVALTLASATYTGLYLTRTYEPPPSPFVVGSYRVCLDAWGMQVWRPALAVENWWWDRELTLCKDHLIGSRSLLPLAPVRSY